MVPPDGIELTDDEDATIEPVLRRLIGPWADTVLEGLHRFDQARPQEEPHYYLSLLGTRTNRRGEGLGMALLADCLDMIDAEHQPASLESSNPSNNSRYEAVGFAEIGTFTTPKNGPVVTQMWRSAR